MVDIVSPEARSKMMSRIRRRDTKPELALRRALHGLGFRYLVDDRRLPGSPDIVLPKWKTVLFVHGCYWHRHEGCSKATDPASNVEFWNKKFQQNKERDALSVRKLVEAGWRVGIVWECVIGSRASTDVVEPISQFITGEQTGVRVFE